MANSKPDPLASKVFEFAAKFAEFRYRAEYFWCEDGEDREEDQDLQYLERDKQILIDLATEISRIPSAASAAPALSGFMNAVGDFWQEYQKQWNGTERKNKLREARHFDAEQMYARDRFLLQQSPMGRTSWAKVQFPMKVVTEAFDSAPQACLEVSALLAAELNPIFVGEERTRSDQGRLAYFATEFSQKVKQAMVSVAEHFPWASRLSLDFSGGDIQSVITSIRNLWLQIHGLLEDPAKVPGYLGLVFDEPGGWLLRNSQKRQELERPLLWKILKRLEKSGEDFCSRESLETAWLASATDPPFPQTFDRAISDLREVLRGLGLKIKCSRGVGYRLEIERAGTLRRKRR